MDFGFATVAAITVICFLICQGLKAAGVNEKWMPVICGLLGGALGGVFWQTIAGYPAQDAFTAVVVGIVSGWAATGAHQVGKQINK